MSFEIYLFESDYLKNRVISMEDCVLTKLKIPNSYPNVFFTKDFDADYECDILVIEVTEKNLDVKKLMDLECKSRFARSVIVTNTPFSSLDCFVSQKVRLPFVYMRNSEVLYPVNNPLILLEKNCLREICVEKESYPKESCEKIGFTFNVNNNSKCKSCLKVSCNNFDDASIHSERYQINCNFSSQKSVLSGFYSFEYENMNMSSKVTVMLNEESVVTSQERSSSPSQEISTSVADSTQECVDVNKEFKCLSSRDALGLTKKSKHFSSLPWHETTSRSLIRDSKNIIGNAGFYDSSKKRRKYCLVNVFEYDTFSDSSSEFSDESSINEFDEHFSLHLEGNIFKIRKHKCVKRNNSQTKRRKKNNYSQQNDLD